MDVCHQRLPRRHRPRNVPPPRLPASGRPLSDRSTDGPRIWQPPRENDDSPHHSTMHWRSASPSIGFGPLRKHPFKVRRANSARDEIEAPVRALIGAGLSRNREATATARSDTEAPHTPTDTPADPRAKALLRRHCGRSTRHEARRLRSRFFWVANKAVRRRQWSGIRGNQ